MAVVAVTRPKRDPGHVHGQQVLSHPPLLQNRDQNRGQGQGRRHGGGHDRQHGPPRPAKGPHERQGQQHQAPDAEDLYVPALYLALRRRALPCFTPTRFYLDVQPRPYFIFHFFSKQLVSQKLKMVTIDAILNHLLTIVET